MSPHVVSAPGPGNHPPTGAGLHLGPKTSLEASEYWATAAERLGYWFSPHAS